MIFAKEFQGFQRNPAFSRETGRDIMSLYLRQHVTFLVILGILGTARFWAMFRFPGSKWSFDPSVGAFIILCSRLSPFRPLLGAVCPAASSEIVT